MKPKIKVYFNNDQVILVWKYSKAIKNCIGFAIYRRLNNESADVAEPITNRVGFHDENYRKGDQRPTTEWPVQRFLWTDYTVRHGEKVSYKIVPMLLDDDELIKDDENSSEWTKPVKVETGKEIGAYFNRGVVSSQFFSKMLYNSDIENKNVQSVIEGGANKLRNFLGGYLAGQLFKILDEIIEDKELTVYAALYELRQKDLIKKLKKVGKRANVVLANGAFKKKKEDKNKLSRKELRKGKVNVFNRIVGTRHFAHNKFLVICENGKPKRVWSGSTNWTPGGLFSQVNNGIYFRNNPELAQHYLEQWEELKKAKGDYTDELYDFNTDAKKAGTNIRVWFSPTGEQGDLNDCRELMDKAEQGILFLMFNPGPKNTLFNKILDIQKHKKDIYIHGIINQDPGGSKNPLIFFHKGSQIRTDWNAILPRKINKAFSFWYPEKGSGFVTIHSKVIVIDPFGKKPYVITGSNNLGTKASYSNDENLLIIKDSKLAEEYAVNIMAVYEHYRWRYSLFRKNTDYKGLSRDADWMENYIDSPRFKELSFWMGEDEE